MYHDLFIAIFYLLNIMLSNLLSSFQGFGLHNGAESFSLHILLTFYQ